MLRRILPVLFVFALAGRAEAQDALVLPLQGRLLDANDTPVEGKVPVTIGLYPVAADVAGQPPTAAIWSETYEVTFSRGLFAVPLGEPSLGRSLPLAAFASGPQTYLAFTIGGTQLSPRLRVGTVPLAARAIDASTLAGAAPATYHDAALLTGTVPAAALGNAIQAVQAGSGPLTATRAGTTVTLGLPAADATHDGYLSSADFARFAAGAAAAGAVASDTTPGLLAPTDYARFAAAATTVASDTTGGLLAAADHARFAAAATAAATALQTVSVAAGTPIVVTKSATDERLSMSAATDADPGYLTAADHRLLAGAVQGVTAASPLTASRSGSTVSLGFGASPTFGGTVTADGLASLGAVTAAKEIRVGVNETAACVPGTLRLRSTTGAFEACVGTGSTGTWRTLAVVTNDGATQATPGTSCKTILAGGFSRGDGAYWIDPNGGSVADAFQTWCDMTTAGGGWTLVAYNKNKGRTFLTGTYHAVAGSLVPANGQEAAIDPDAVGLTYTQIAFYNDDPQWTGSQRNYNGFWVGSDSRSTYNLKSNTCQLLNPTDPATQWSGQLVYFAGDGANDNGCTGGGSVFTTGHTCDDGGGGITTNTVWPTNGSDPLWGYNCVTSYSPTGSYKTSALSNQGLHAYYVR